MQARKYFVVTSAHSGDDVRVFKKYLTSISKREEFDVHSVRLDAYSSVENETKNIVLQRVSKNRLVRFLTSIFIFGIFFIRLHKILTPGDIIHVHDPELMPLAMLKVVFPGVVFIYDMHEHLPSQIYNKVSGKYARRIIIKIVELLEKIFLPKFDHLVFVTNEINHKYTHRSKITVHNYPLSAPRDQGIQNRSRSTKCIKLVYAGGIGPNRFLEELIDIVSNYPDRYELHLFGRITFPEKDQWLAQNVYSCMNVVYGGVVDLTEIPEILCSHDVGIHVVKDIPNHRVGLPTKVFDYLSAGLLVVTNNFEINRSTFSDLCIYCEASKVGIETQLELISEDMLSDQKRFERVERLYKKNYSWEHEMVKYMKFLEIGDV